MTEHVLRATDETVTVGQLDREFPPVLAIEPGDTVTLETMNHWADGVTPETSIDDVIELRSSKYPEVGPHSVTGPIEVAGARPGDVLRVAVERLVPREHGFNLFMPGAFKLGLLYEEFPEGRIRHFEHDLEAMTTEFLPGVTLPLAPFLGIMAVAPEDPGPHHTMPPGLYGGNLDIPELVEGAVLYLPVQVDGALFSAGDAHSRQGHGEVCLTAIETAMDEARLRFSLLEGREWPQPRVETPEAWITVGLDPDLLKAARAAVRDMMRLLGEQYGLKRDDAYSLCSVAADLSVTQVVNGVRGVQARLSKALFAGSEATG